MMVTDDGFNSFAGGEDRLITGDMVTFADGVFRVGKERAALPEDLIAISVKARWQKWQNKRVVDTAFLNESGRFPDRGDLGDLDESQWEVGLDGETRKDPWSNARFVELFNATDGSIFTFTSASAGGRRAVSDLCERTLRMRAVRGTNVYPTVSLGTKPMKTRFGTKAAPHFVITGWVANGASGPLPTAPPALAAPAPLKSVEEPSLREELSDDIPL
jgi:hypothetical protein